MASAPDRLDPVFGDALAGDGGMTDPVSTGPRRDTSFDVFPDALSALPLPALTLVLPDPGAGPGEVASGVAVPGVTPPGRPAVPQRPPVVLASNRAPNRASNRTASAPAPFGPPTGPSWSGYPAPGSAVGRPAAAPLPIAAAAPYARPAAPVRQTRPATFTTSAGGVLAPASGRRPVAGVGYTPPATTASGVVRPPAYLPQNSGLAGLRAAIEQARGTVRPPASPPSSVRPDPPTRTRRRSGSSSAWALVVFVVIFLVSSGTGQQIVNAISQLLHHR